jgi:hypothetical protein
MPSVRPGCRRGYRFVQSHSSIVIVSLPSGGNFGGLTGPCRSVGFGVRTCETHQVAWQPSWAAHTGRGGAIDPDLVAPPRGSAPTDLAVVGYVVDVVCGVHRDEVIDAVVVEIGDDDLGIAAEAPQEGGGSQADAVGDSVGFEEDVAIAGKTNEVRRAVGVEVGDGDLGAAAEAPYEADGSPSAETVSPVARVVMVSFFTIGLAAALASCTTRTSVNPPRLLTVSFRSTPGNTPG